MICLDSLVLIDYYRKTNKNSSFFFRLTKQYQGFVLPVTAHFEILVGINETQQNFWQNVFSDPLIIPYPPYLNTTAVGIQKKLKEKRKSIDFKDLLIATTAVHYNYQLATINEKHFVHIENLKLITPNDFRA